MPAQDSDQTLSGPGFRWDPHPVLTHAVNEWRQAKHPQELYLRFWLQAIKDQTVKDLYLTPGRLNLLFFVRVVGTGEDNDTPSDKISPGEFFGPASKDQQLMSKAVVLEFWTTASVVEYYNGNGIILATAYHHVGGMTGARPHTFQRLVRGQSIWMGLCSTSGVNRNKGQNGEAPKIARLLEAEGITLHSTAAPLVPG